VAAEHGLAILAAGTHPTAAWRSAQQTNKERYDSVMHDLQMIGQRDLLCGLHVHVELPDPDDRIDLMYRMLPYLPLFLALSTSSPFWQSRSTGLKGYRLAAYDELPLYRTLARHLYLNRWRNCDLDPVGRAIIVENKWQAQRHGVHATFAAEDGAVTVAEMLERVICETSADAEAFGCSAEINRCRAIVSSGTSADAQLAVFEAQSRNGSRGAALRAVTEWIAAATLQ
jgi:gamma-glutamyl:cysteine ligase YbdK (ATP-grasp superfamily)